MVSVHSSGAYGDDQSYAYAINADGRYVAFYSYATNLVDADTNGKSDVFVHDRQDGATTRVSVASNGTQGDNYSYSPAISADGRYVTFYSYATNLVDGDTNGFEDIFVHDRQSGATTRVSVASNGAQGDNDSDFCAISANGKYVTFDSMATNLAVGNTNGTWDVYVRGPLTSFPWPMFLPATTGAKPF